MPRSIALVILSPALIASCVRPELEPVEPPRDQPKRPPDLVEIEVGASTYHWFSAPQSGGNTSDAATFERQITETERTVLTVNQGSSRAEVRHFVDRYLAKPGFWKEIALSPGDPDRGWEGYEAVLSPEKTEFLESEPIVLHLSIDSHRMFDAPWWLFTPARIRVQDAEGRDVNLFCRPVCGEDGAVRSKVFSFRKETSFDLTSFVEPYYGVEAVNRFAPGTYTATFHFTRSDVWPDDSFSASDFAQPQAWGPKKSNTVPFTVQPAGERAGADIDALFRQAEALVAEDRANAAAAACRRIVLESSDRKTIEKAILRILHIRLAARALHDGDRLLSEGKTRSLSERMDKGLSEVRHDYAEVLKDQALRLSLLHVSADEARAWYRAVVRVRDYLHFREPATPLEERLSRVDCVNFEELFRYPLYGSLLMEDLRSPEPCLASCVRIYLALPGPKRPRLVGKLLAEHPDVVLDHYCRNAAPRWLVPRIAYLFDDNTPMWGNNSLQAERRDAAYLAFERAAGLKLGHDRLDRYRIGHRTAIERMLRDWWERNRKAFEKEKEPRP